MTPLEIITAGRQRYNAVSDSFWSDAELYNLLYAAMLEAARETLMLEGTPTLTSTAAVRSYALPSTLIAIKRVTYAGAKLEPITFREDDAITTSQEALTAQGTPQYYSIWNGSIYLRPVPATSNDTIQFYSYVLPALPTATSTLEMPTLFHMDLVNYIAALMYAKDGNPQMSQFYMTLWQKSLAQMRAWSRKRRQTDQFRHSFDEDNLPSTILGMV